MTKPSSPTVKKVKCVLWASTNTHHTVNYSKTPCKTRALPHTSVATPRSILKRTSQLFLDLPISEHQMREVTPEPQSAENSTEYLSNPINIIVRNEDAIHSLTEAYNQLILRLKAMGEAISSVGARLLALKPLVESKDAMVSAISRDIGRALVNTKAADDENMPPREGKKGGMTEEEVKTARDVSMLSVSALRFNSLILSSTALQQVFSTEQVMDLTTALLSIPLAPVIPTPNSRKTYSVAISIISSCVLPEPVAQKAAHRVIYALRRAVDGELGREGKKGSIADGMKAIRELAIQHPQHFIGGFTPLLPSVFAHLLSPSTANQMNASAALMGIAIGCQTCPSKTFREAFEGSLRDVHLVLQKALRDALAPNAASAPWALCTLASIVSISQASSRATRLALTVGPIAMAHKKQGVRMLGSFVWKCLARELLCKQSVPQQSWKLLDQVLDNGVGLSIIAGRVAQSELEPALQTLQTMVCKGGKTCGEGVPILLRLVSFDLSSEEIRQWDADHVIPEELFDGTLLTAPYSQIGSAVKDSLSNERLLSLDDIRPMTKAEVEEHWEVLIAIWKGAAITAELGPDGDMPPELATVWRQLLCARTEDHECQEDRTALQNEITKILKNFLVDTAFSWSSKHPDAQPALALKYGFVTNLWSIAREALLSTTLCVPASNLLGEIIAEQPDASCVAAWADMLGQVAVLAPEGEAAIVLRDVARLECSQTRALPLVWKSLLSAWTSADGSADDALYLLVYPFSHAEEISASDIDEEIWYECWRIYSLKAQDEGATTSDVLKTLAQRLRGNWHAFLPRAIQKLIPCVYIEESTSTSLATLCEYALHGAYERARGSSDVRLKAQWLVSDLASLVLQVDSEKLVFFLPDLQRALCPWILDSNMILSQADYDFVIGALFQSVTGCLELVRPTPLRNLLHKLHPLFAAAFQAKAAGRQSSEALQHLEPFLENCCSHIPPDQWSPALVPYISHLPSFTRLPAERLLEEAVQPHTPITQSTLSVLSNLAQLPCTPVKLSIGTICSPKKRSLSHSEDSIPRKKRRVLSFQANENDPPTPSLNRKRHRSMQCRSPLKDLKLDITLLASPSSICKSDKPLLLHSDDSAPRKRYIVDYVSVPTLAQFQLEQKRSRQHESSRQEPTCHSPNHATYADSWPNSDDTLVADDSPSKTSGSDDHFFSPQKAAIVTSPCFLRKADWELAS